jgi:D-alanine-D-alanine ligase
LVKKLRVGVVFGGRSGEHEVSIRSARAVIDAFDKERYEVVPVYISKTGKWLSPSDSIQFLPPETSRRIPRSILKSKSEAVAIIADPSQRGLVSVDGNGTEPQRIDVLFPVLHGTYGEDGTIQGLFEMANIPYVGCGVLASSCGMDKVTMKALFREAGLPLCKYAWFLRSEWEQDRRVIVRRIRKEIGFPCFVKPANLGSSVGVSKAVDRLSLEESIDLAARYDRKIIVEEGLDVREIECAVLGNDEPLASLPGEYVLKDRAAAFLDYTEKYSNTGRIEFVVPAPIPKALTAKIQKMATRAFKAIDGAGLARVDFFLRRDNGVLLINELNTLPGLTDVSGFPKMWQSSGVPFDQLLERLISLAVESHSEKDRNVTSI